MGGRVLKTEQIHALTQCLDFSALLQKPAPELTSLALYINASVSACIFQWMERLSRLCRSALAPSGCGTNSRSAGCPRIQPGLRAPGTVPHHQCLGCWSLLRHSATSPCEGLGWLPALQDLQDLCAPDRNATSLNFQNYFEPRLPGPHALLATAFPSGCIKVVQRTRCHNFAPCAPYHAVFHDGSFIPPLSCCQQKWQHPLSGPSGA